MNKKQLIFVFFALITGTILPATEILLDQQTSIEQEITTVIEAIDKVPVRFLDYSREAQRNIIIGDALVILLTTVSGHFAGRYINLLIADPREPAISLFKPTSWTRTVTIGSGMGFTTGFIIALYEYFKGKKLSNGILLLKKELLITALTYQNDPENLKKALYTDKNYPRTRAFQDLEYIRTYLTQTIDAFTFHTTTTPSEENLKTLIPKLQNYLDAVIDAILIIKSDSLWLEESQRHKKMMIAFGFACVALGTRMLARHLRSTPEPICERYYYYPSYV